jgi:tetratricopeptide (TPR) repeat protein
LEALSPSASPDAWRDWIAAHPGNIAGLKAYAGMLIAAERWDEARDALQQAVAINPTETGPESPARMLANLLRQLGDTEQERAVLSAITMHDPSATDVYLRLMELASAAEDWPAVRVHAQQALAVNPLIPQPHRALADAAEKLADSDEAIAALRTLLALPHDDAAELHFRLGRLLNVKGETADARRHVLLALERAPRYREAQSLLLKLVRKQPATGPRRTPCPNRKRGTRINAN